MRRRQTIRGPIITMDLELLHTVHAFQGAKSLQWHLRGAGDKLQELRTFRLIETAQCTPEPLNLERQMFLFH
jgi:hypothetical protein